MTVVPSDRLHTWNREPSVKIPDGQPESCSELHCASQSSQETISGQRGTAELGCPLARYPIVDIAPRHLMLLFYLVNN